MRTHILKTLLWKEALRFRANWGLLVMVGGVLALATLLSISARLGQLPGQQERLIQSCLLLVERGDAAGDAWLGALRQAVPSQAERARLGMGDFAWHYKDQFRGAEGFNLPFRCLGVELCPPMSGSKTDTWSLRYWAPENAESDAMPYRLWATKATYSFLGATRVFEEVHSQRGAVRQLQPADRVPVFVTGLTIFAFYLMSFNLYITSTGEEREKKALLALMLTPATPGEIIGAKVIFYSMASLLIAVLVVAVYKPPLLLDPKLWLIIFLGSVCYIAIGTVILCFVRRQTTINSVSMIYLIFTALVMFMAVFLLPFYVLKHALIENYVFRQLVEVVSGKETANWPLDFLAIVGITLAWVCGALRIFRTSGMKIAHAGR